MRLPLRHLFLALLFATIVRAEGTALSPAAPATFFRSLAAGRHQTVVVYGTSLTAAGEWPNALRRYFDRHFPGQVAFVNAAQSGQHSNWGVANLEQRVLSQNPDLVFLEFSVNDAATKHHITIAQSVANLDTMVQALLRQNPGIDIVVQTMNPAWDSPGEPSGKKYASDRPQLADYYDACRAYARRQNLTLVDHYPTWLKLRQTDEPAFEKWVPDGIHPVPEASLAVTWPAIQALLETAHQPFVSIETRGAVADGATINTAAIQKIIDDLAARGGGTVVVPAGVFVSGALDFRPGVHLHLEKGAVLRAASTDVAKHFPTRPTRIEGLFVDYTPALINADRCDGFRLTGEGVLDGDGRPIWDEFWRLRKASPDPKNFANRAIPRARLAFISNSRDVRIDGVTFKDSQFWNLHLYLCRDVVVRGVTVCVPDDYKQAPSTDAIDIDSSQEVFVEHCTFSVTDDAVALKGSKGPRALEDASSPPVECVVIRYCTFKRAHAALTFGSEATVVRDVLLDNSRVTGPMSVLNLKLRTDTPQTYETIAVRDLTLDSSGGALVTVAPWKQYADLQGLAPPESVVRNITISGITGRYGSFGGIEGNKGQTTLDGFLFKDIDLQLAKDQLKTRDVKNLRLENVVINGVAR